MAPMGDAGLPHLPAEVLTLILEDLDYRDRCSLRATCLPLWLAVNDRWIEYLETWCPEHAKCFSDVPLTEFRAEFAVAQLICRVSKRWFSKSCRELNEELQEQGFARSSRLLRPATLPNRTYLFEKHAWFEPCIHCSHACCDACGAVYDLRGDYDSVNHRRPKEGPRFLLNGPSSMNEFMMRLYCFDCLDSSMNLSGPPDIGKISVEEAEITCVEYGVKLSDFLKFCDTVVQKNAEHYAPKECAWILSRWRAPQKYDDDVPGMLFKAHLKFLRHQNPTIDRLAATNEAKAQIQWHKSEAALAAQEAERKAQRLRFLASVGNPEGLSLADAQAQGLWLPQGI